MSTTKNIMIIYGTEAYLMEEGRKKFFAAARKRSGGDAEVQTFQKDAVIGHELKKAGIDLDQEQLRIEGLRWEMEHSGRNGRIAQQFVKWYLNNHNS